MAGQAIEALQSRVLGKGMRVLPARVLATEPRQCCPGIASLAQRPAAGSHQLYQVAYSGPWALLWPLQPCLVSHSSVK
jgi:hypothetical protein